MHGSIARPELRALPQPLRSGRCPPSDMFVRDNELSDLIASAQKILFVICLTVWDEPRKNHAIIRVWKMDFMRITKSQNDL
jgi:hypothetical protein